jgi:sugar phosphate permease
MFAHPNTAAAKMKTTAAPSLKDSSQRWWLVALMHLGMFFCYVHRSALSIALPFMISELKLSTAVAGVLLSAFFWPYAFMQTPAGWAVDRFGVKRVYAWGYTVWSLAAVATGLARGLVAIVAARACLGMGQSVIFPAHARAVAIWFSERERGTATALANSGSRLGQALVNGVGPLLIAAVGWQSFFFTTGIMPLIWLAPWMMFMRRWDGSNAADDGANRLKEMSFLRSFSLLKRRSMRGLCLGYFCYNYAWILLYTWLPGYLAVERKFGAREMAFFSSVPYLLGFVIALLAGAAADWLVRRGFNEAQVRKTFMTAGMAGACLIVPAGMVEDKMAAVWLLGVALSSLSVSGVTSWALIQAVCEKEIVGTAGGVQNFSGNLGGILAPALTGFIAHSTGSFALALGLTGALLVAGIAFYWLMVSEKVTMGEAMEQHAER